MQVNQPHKPHQEAVLLAYEAHELDRGSIIQALEHRLGLMLTQLDTALQHTEPYNVTTARPIAIVRPVELFGDGRSLARNPLPQYVFAIAKQLLKTHVVISVANTRDYDYQLAEPLPPAHIRYHVGELSRDALLGLVQQADVCVGGPGWMVPAAIATRTPAFFVMGGWGRFSSKRHIVDERCEAKHLGWAFPEPFCGCDYIYHQCNKHIDALDDQFDAWYKRVRPNNSLQFA